MDPTQTNLSLFKQFQEQDRLVHLTKLVRELCHNTLADIDSAEIGKIVVPLLSEGVKNYFKDGSEFEKISIYHLNFEVSYNHAIQDLICERIRKVDLILCASTINPNSIFSCLHKELIYNILTFMRSPFPNLEEFKFEIWSQLQLADVNECVYQFEAFEKKIKSPENENSRTCTIL